jgi:hypothetical protein
LVSQAQPNGQIHSIIFETESEYNISNDNASFAFGFGGNGSKSAR